MILSVIVFSLFAADGGRSWSGYRGDNGDSVATAVRKLPLEWSTEKNIAWKVDLPGYGQSSPVVWRGVVYVTSIDGPAKEKLRLHAFSLKDGKLRWTREFASSAPEKVHDRLSKAAPTPSVDAKGVYAFYESGDLIAATHKGETRWHRKLGSEYGPFQTNHGLGSSIRLAFGKVFVFLSHMGPSALLAVDPASGKDVWKAELPKSPSFTTPAAIKHKDQEMVLISAGGGAAAYDAATGRQLWSRPGKGGRGYGVPSPSISGSTVVIPSSEKGGTIAFSLNKPSENLYISPNATTEFSAPLIHDGLVYMINAVGAVFCFDLATGTEHYTTRLTGSHWASAIAVEGRVYFFGLEGKTTVVAAGKEFKKIAENTLPVEGRVYGVAAVEDTLLIRTGKQLYAIR